MMIGYVSHIFDSQNPSGEAQQLFYRTLGRLLSARPGVKIVVIAGNQAAASPHDEFRIRSDRAQPSDSHWHDIRVLVHHCSRRRNLRRRLYREPLMQL
jgi:hypothetical protein